MFKHQYNFDIKIPKEVVTKKKHDHIFEGSLENKSIIGLCGYSKSGKDYIAKTFIDKYNYHRVAFADNLKIEMNMYLKESVFEFIKSKGITKEYDHTRFDDMDNGLFLDDGRILTLNMIDFLTEDISVKKRLRPFIIWYGEKLREINGEYYWINQAFKIDADGYDKIIISDVRRAKELDVFENSNSFIKRTREMFASAGYIEDVPVIKIKSFSSLLFHVNQLNLTDKDILTCDCIRIAQEKWMFDKVIYVDSRLPETGKGRSKAMKHQIDNIVKEFGIETLDKTVAWGRQKKLF